MFVARFQRNVNRHAPLGINRINHYARIRDIRECGVRDDERYPGQTPRYHEILHGTPYECGQILSNQYTLNGFGKRFRNLVSVEDAIS